MNREARWWTMLPDGRIECLLCPRHCKMAEGASGFCRVRGVHNRRLETVVYGNTSGFCLDSVEKKPLYHFLPGTTTLSFGTASCNLGCIFCQNWLLTKREIEPLLTHRVTPADVVAKARKERCESVSFTYNEPIISAEFVVDVAEECRKEGLKSIAVTSGYIDGEARSQFFAAVDAANIDLKGFSEEFYHLYCAATLSPVLETLRYVRRHTNVWLEITNLLIPGGNDDDASIDAMTKWIVDALGSETPLHFSAFHPDYHLLDRPPTSPETLFRAQSIAQKNGLKFVYLGNLRTSRGANTSCPKCQNLVIQREGFHVAKLELRQGKCSVCQEAIPGLF